MARSRSHHRSRQPRRRPQPEQRLERAPRNHPPRPRTAQRGLVPRRGPRARGADAVAGALPHSYGFLLGPRFTVHTPPANGPPATPGMSFSFPQSRHARYFVPASDCFRVHRCHPKRQRNDFAILASFGSLGESTTARYGHTMRRRGWSGSCRAGFRTCPRSRSTTGACARSSS